MMVQGLFKDRADFIRYVKENKAKNKTHLADILDTSRPSLYRLIDNLEVNEDHLNEIFRLHRLHSGGKEAVNEQLLLLHPDCKIDRFYFKFQELIVVNDCMAYRTIGNKPKLLPSIFRGDTEYCSWSFSGKQRTVKKANLMYMLMNGVKEIEKGFKVEFVNGDEKDFSRGNLVIRNKKKERLDCCKYIEDNIGIMDDTEMLDFLKAYFGK